ncbi:MAG: 23S rRNA pseudouridine(955/2504/2580) synthase RluC [Chromatiales bacterium]|jgi:23S rRNA pseudouridine955/2504/2580 synthase
MSGQTQHKVRLLRIGEEADAQRIDNFLQRHLKGVPRSHIYRLLRSGQVRVNGKRIKQHFRLSVGDEVRIPPVRTAQAAAPGKLTDQQRQLLNDSILFEDKTLLVMNKPSGIAVHGGSGISLGIIEQLRLLRPEEKGLELVHRLDRATSGLLMIAKRRSALRTLHALQRENRIRKSYLALVQGDWPENRMRVDVPLRKNQLRGGERIVTVDEEGKTALTLFRIKEQFREAMLVEAELGSGRTHQIRVHAAHLGTPIIGDDKYGDSEVNRHYRQLGLKRLFLHAWKLAFEWGEEGKMLKLTAPLEPALEELLTKLRVA